MACADRRHFLITLITLCTQAKISPFVSPQDILAEDNRMALGTEAK